MKGNNRSTLELLQRLSLGRVKESIPVRFVGGDAPTKDGMRQQLYELGRSMVVMELVLGRLGRE